MVMYISADKDMSAILIANQSPENKVKLKRM